MHDTDHLHEARHFPLQQSIHRPYWMTNQPPSTKCWFRHQKAAPMGHWTPHRFHIAPHITLHLRCFYCIMAGCLMGSWTWAKRNGLTTNGIHLLTSAWVKAKARPSGLSRAAFATSLHLVFQSHRTTPGFPTALCIFRASCFRPHLPLPGLPCSSFIP